MDSGYAKLCEESREERAEDEGRNRAKGVE